MKEGLNAAAASRIANAIVKVYPAFDVAQFEALTQEGLAQLELKERVNHYIEVLAKLLPQDFVDCHKILTQLTPHWDHGIPDDPLRYFAAWPVTDFVAVYGLDHPELSFECMHHLTCLFSAEFAIRPFIQKYPELSRAYLDKWLNDEDEHVRRLTSEGTRPRLPWGIRLQEFCIDPSPNLAGLTQLRDDESEYVRRSVANHLNDIAKDNPDTVIQLCRSWQKGASKNTLWVIKHACRSLIKLGKPEVFPLLGFTENPQVKASSLSIENEQVIQGDSLSFSVDITSTAKSPQKLAIDFVIYHMKANGQLSPKVFKWKELSLKANEKVTLAKQHKMKAISTRKYYSGEHRIAFTINGKEQPSTSFNFHIPA